MEGRSAVRREAQQLTRLVVRAAAALGIAVATVTPIGFLALSLRYEMTELSNGVDRRAALVSQHVYRASGKWAFDVLRLEEIIQPARRETVPTEYRIEQPIGDSWRKIVAVGRRPAWPRIETAAEILDGDVVVGRLIAEGEIRHVLLHLLFVAAASGALGFAVFALVRFLAMPAIEASFLRLAARDEQLAAHRAELERTIAERTVSLRESNTELTRSLTELQASEAQNQRLALIAQRTDSAILITGADGSIEWVNPAFTQLSGYELDELVGRRPGNLLHGPETDPETIRTMNAARAAGHGFSVELLNYHKNGSRHWVEITCTTVRDERGVIQQYISVERDITLRKQQEARLAAALEHEREVTQHQRRFVSVVAHEFRTPLTIIDGAAQRLARHATQITEDDLRARTDKIRTAVTRMSQLVETTLNAARLDAGAIRPNFTELDLGALLGGICERIRGIAVDFDIRLAGLDTQMQIPGDERLLDQVFTNLLTNAVKYSGTSKRIDITCAVLRDAVTIAIRDFGIGVAEDELTKLFTRFYRASTARGLPGTGIGLNLARELVILHKGDLTVESRVGEGSTFTVSLPRQAELATAESPQAA